MIHHSYGIFSPWAILWGLVAVLLAFGLHSLYFWFRRHKKPHIKALGHVHHHLIIGIIVALTIGFTLGVTITKGMGLIHNSKLHVKPSAASVKYGAAAPYSYSFWRYLPNVVADQGDTNSCVAFAMNMARWLEDNLRGENLPDIFSGFYTYWWVTGGANSPTSVESESSSIVNHGTTLLGNQPYFGAPSQAAIDNSFEYGGGFHYLFYNFSGQDSLDAIKAEVSNNVPVILLLQVNDGFQNAFGQSWTDNAGGFIDYHAVVVYGYSGNNFDIRNSWGPGFGNGGNIELTSYAMFNSVIGALVVDPSPSVAFPAYVAPTSTPVPPPPPPTAVPPTPLPTRTPVPPVRPTYRVRVNTHYRSRPNLSAVEKYVVRRNWKLIDLHKQTASWRYTKTLNSKYRGWVLKANLCPVAARRCSLPPSRKHKHHHHTPGYIKNHLYKVIKNVSLHNSPTIRKHGWYLIHKGSRVRYLGKQTPRWLKVWYNKRVGFILKNSVQKK